MSFLGKEYKFHSQEKFDGFLKSAGLPDAEVQKFLEFKPTTKLEKDGDFYKSTSTTPEGSKTVTFKSGVEFDEKIKEIIPVKTTYTVDGNVVTQVIKADKGSATFKREYTDTDLIVTITSSNWDGVAKRYYKA